ncbi:MAG: ribosome biogenesis GTP-binding protein YihA/YsxC [Pseudomonadota bacterium]
MTETDAPFSAAEIEAARKFFAGPCDFVKGVVDLKHLPPDAHPEVAFLGRSNVGKSSLINALTGRKSLARTSNTPGRTRELNFFLLSQGMYLVDLPGYGYAKVSRSDAKRWTTLARNYLRGRARLKRVFLLIDSRHGLKPSDAETMDLFDEAAVPYQIALTKIDKLKAGALADCRAATSDALKRRPAAHPRIVSTSSVKGDGVDMLRAEAAALL